MIYIPGKIVKQSGLPLQNVVNIQGGRERNELSACVVEYTRTHTHTHTHTDIHIYI